MVERLTHHHVHAERLGAGHRVGGPQAEEGHVHEHVGPLAERGQPAHALHRQLDLPRSRRNRDVQRAHGARADHPVGLEAVPALETFQRVDQGTGQEWRVAARVHLRSGRQVTERAQTRRQLRHAGPRGAGCHLAAARHRRHRRRLAGRGQRPVGRQGGARPLVVLYRRLESLERGGESGLARLAKPRHEIEGLGRHVVAPQHRRRIDAAQMHRFQHARGAHRHGHVEERPLRARHRAGFQARPLVTERGCVVVGGTQPVVARCRQRDQRAVECGDRP